MGRKSIDESKLTHEEGASHGDGSISREWTFWCALCAEWQQIGTENTQAGAIEAAHTFGWRKTKRFGWVCVECRRRCR